MAIMRFATRILVIQVLTVAVVVAVCSAVFTFLTVEQLKAEAEQSALSISRVVAADPQVRDEVARDTFTGAEPTAAELARGPLQEFAHSAQVSTGALFIVITDGNGIRLAHPDQQRLGQVVSTGFDAALRGEETIAWETGTLGESARAKVPVFAPGTTTPVGGVSVGFERASVFDRLPPLLMTVAAGAVLALILGAGVAVVMRRRWEEITLGLQPEELVELLKNHTAVLNGVEEGVLALRPDGTIDVHNQQAREITGIEALAGRTLPELGMDEGIVDKLLRGDRPGAVSLNNRILYLDSHPVTRGDQELGHVITIRDRTDMVELTERLDSVRTMTQALRAQRHEFSNRIHTATGLIDAGRPHDAAAFLRSIGGHGGQVHPLLGAELLEEAFLSSFITTAAITASERGVGLRITDDTLILGEVDNAEDIATVLGNLLTNAIDAAARGDEPRRVDLTLLDDGDTLVMTVADTGPGITGDVDVFAAPPVVDDWTDAIHGHGLGLKLSRALARSLGGDVWIIDRGGQQPGSGAVFGASLPGVMRSGQPSPAPLTPEGKDDR
ncbi:ATPase/histidine kinase/DNA gyrase B/HSP90 domain protein [Corynebacterium efficiens YS-314]|uniref:Sensor-like histidine kinase SenX3 n=1 Tax=Corynebacterium efficiens (strain DSM 44549 / YS-314 / AJ 12310 / JCM 11189 / NBRC 100395) TaxID=196164 RepID=Q8FSY7_COREF|nr:sensor histidine kinase [Corynebacterium efficiens]EEW48579.1 ATPase/histidine kinase/DNA gyrase B/HSP90 domain protein [Corynebacterium efficiens YS-314]BAC19715.1 putative sensor kinase [Corynebacterium efficiens YS-314]